MKIYKGDWRAFTPQVKNFLGLKIMVLTYITQSQQKPFGVYMIILSHIITQSQMFFMPQKGMEINNLAFGQIKRGGTLYPIGNQDYQLRKASPLS